MRPPGAKAIVCFRDKILLVLRDNNPQISNPNKWNTPGGAIEKNESPFQALVRELKEEINFTPSIIINLGSTTYSDESLVYRFFCPVSEEEYKQIYLVGEGQRLNWFTFEEALRLAKTEEISQYLGVYIHAAANDIKSLLEGRRDFKPKNFRLELR